MHQKINARKRGGPVSIFWSILDPFWELKTFKNHCKNNGFETFSRFLQKLKKEPFRKQTGVDFGAHLEIRGSQNPPFRASAIAGYLQIHLPNEIT